MVDLIPRPVCLLKKALRHKFRRLARSKYLIRCPIGIVYRVIALVSCQVMVVLDAMAKPPGCCGCQA
eukprot:2283973-Prorocentrum_lima.AAC.1